MFTVNTQYKTAYAESRSVTHFFTHALIAYPEIAFNENNPMRNSYDVDCITVDEFKRFLESIYNNDYMLIDIDSVYTVNGGTTVKNNFEFPHDKKPCILSFDDINYYIKKMNLGMNDKLIVVDGQIATFTQNASEQINYDNECVTVLENFIKEHPDFSYNNAKGIINVTGFDGVLGYRTDRDSLDRDNEIIKAKQVADLLKDKNWKFACHSYGHYRMKSISVDKFILDTKDWIREVEPIVGKTNLYVYPYGEWEINIETALSKKHKYLQECGFNMFFGVGTAGYFGRVPFEKTTFEKPMFMDRIPIDGNSLRNHKTLYSKMFDVEYVYDNEIRYITI